MITSGLDKLVKIFNLENGELVYNIQLDYFPNKILSVETKNTKKAIILLEEPFKIEININNLKYNFFNFNFLNIKQILSVIINNRKHYLLVTRKVIYIFNESFKYISKKYTLIQNFDILSINKYNEYYFICDTNNNFYLAIFDDPYPKEPEPDPKEKKAKVQKKGQEPEKEEVKEEDFRINIEWRCKLGNDNINFVYFANEDYIFFSCLDHSIYNMNLKKKIEDNKPKVVEEVEEDTKDKNKKGKKKDSANAKDEKEKKTKKKGKKKK